MFHGRISTRIDTAMIPSSKLDETLNLATWNIREFGNSGSGGVRNAAIHYIAEILGQFDLVSIVELRDDLTDLGRVLPILGLYRRAIYSDVIFDAGGNRERIGFIYDKRAVVFTGLAAAANALHSRRRRDADRPYVRRSAVGPARGCGTFAPFGHCAKPRNLSPFRFVVHLMPKRSEILR